MKVRTYSRKKKIQTNTDTAAVFGFANSLSGNDKENDAYKSNGFKIWENDKTKKEKKKKKTFFDSDDDSGSDSGSGYSKSESDSHSIKDDGTYTEISDADKAHSDRIQESEAIKLETSEKSDFVSENDDIYMGTESASKEKAPIKSENNPKDVEGDIVVSKKFEMVDTLDDFLQTNSEQTTMEVSENLVGKLEVEVKDLLSESACEKMDDFDLKFQHEIDNEIMQMQKPKRKSRHVFRRRSRMSIFHMDKIQLESQKNMRRLSVFDVSHNPEIKKNRRPRNAKGRQDFRLSILPSMSTQIKEANELCFLKENESEEKCTVPRNNLNSNVTEDLPEIAEAQVDVDEKDDSKLQNSIAAMSVPSSSGFKLESEALILSSIFEFLDGYTLLHSVCTVNRLWNRLGGTAFNFVTSMVITSRCRELENQYENQLKNLNDLESKFSQLTIGKGNECCRPWHCLPGLIQAFPHGNFIAEGSFKKVFKVWFEPQKRYEAVSVMDLYAIAELGQASMVAQEITVSLMISELVTNRTNPCPFFIETYQVFELSHPPPLDIWTKNKLVDSDSNTIAKNKMGEAIFHYIRMELCQGGDLEEFTKSLENEMFDLSDVRSIIFQMLFAVYVGQKELRLRHFDIKLLNYFVKLVETNSNDETDSSIEVLLDAETKFCIPEMKSLCKNKETTPSDHILVVKLADYGTADISEDTLGAPIQPCHFTTLENTPVEYLLFADAKQSYLADMFDVGLCVVHLFTGGFPYEEILDSVKCPEKLKNVIESLWKSRGRFSTVREVIAEIESDILYDTLYRYVVLFGFAQDEERNTRMRQQSPIWNELCKFLHDPVNKRRATDIVPVREQYINDRDLFSLEVGSHYLIKRARERLDQSNGGWDILKKLIEFEPSQRETAEDILRHSYFDSLIV